MRTFGLECVLVLSALLSGQAAPQIRFLIPANNAAVSTEQPLEFLLEALDIPVAEGLCAIRVLLSQKTPDFWQDTEDVIFNLSDLSGVFLVHRDFVPGPLNLSAVALNGSGVVMDCPGCSVELHLVARGPRMQTSSVEFEESLEEKQMLLLTRELDPLESHSRVSHSAGVEDSLVVSVLTPSASIYVASPVAFSVNIGLASHSCVGAVLGLFVNELLVMNVQMEAHDPAAGDLPLSKLVEFDFSISGGNQ